MYGLVLVIHILVSLVLIGVVLIQGGRGGLSEALGGAAAQSLFGSSAVTVLTRLTTFCAGIFVVTCLSLAYLSTARGRSVIDQIPLTAPEVLPAVPAPLEEPLTSSSPASPDADEQAEPSPSASPPQPPSSEQTSPSP